MKRAERKCGAGKGLKTSSFVREDWYFHSRVALTTESPSGKK